MPLQQATLNDAVTRLTQFFNETWDLTEDLDLATGEPLGDALDAGWRRFRQSVCNALLDQERMSELSSVSAARNAIRTQEMQKQMAQMQAGMHQAVAALAGVSGDAHRMAGAASRSASLMGRTRASAEATSQSAGTMSGATGEITALLRQASEQLAELRQQTRQISDLSKVVKEIATRVNLLALNAAIEAARAGEHGRGFAVVASEVRRLAEGTNRQAGQIDAVIGEVVRRLEETNAQMGSGAERAEELTGRTGEAMSALSEINRMILEVAAPIEQLGAAVEEHAATVGQVSETVGSMARQAEQINDQVRVVAAESRDLLSQVQTTQQALSTFYKGSYIDTLRRTTFALAADLGRVFETAIAAGKVSLADVLALEYTEIKGPLIQRLRGICDVSKVPLTGFAPPKYATRYDHAVDLAMREVLDSYLARHENLLYTTVLDLNAYSLISNTTTCRDWTGDFRTDSLNNRMKRFSTDVVQLEGARLGLKGPSYETIAAGLYVRDMHSVLTRSDLQRYGNSLRQEDEPTGLSNCYTFASLSGKATSFCAVPVYVMGHRYGAALIGWDATGASAPPQPGDHSGTSQSKAAHQVRM